MSELNKLLELESPDRQQEVFQALRIEEIGIAGQYQLEATDVEPITVTNLAATRLTEQQNEHLRGD